MLASMRTSVVAAAQFSGGVDSPEFAGQDGGHDEKARQSAGHHGGRRSSNSVTEHQGHGRDDRHGDNRSDNASKDHGSPPPQQKTAQKGPAQNESETSIGPYRGGGEQSGPVDSIPMKLCSGSTKTFSVRNGPSHNLRVLPISTGDFAGRFACNGKPGRNLRGGKPIAC